MDIIGKYCYTTKGWFSNFIGLVKESDNEEYKYMIEYGGHSTYFNDEAYVVVVEDQDTVISYNKPQ